MNGCHLRPPPHDHTPLLPLRSPVRQAMALTLLTLAAGGVAPAEAQGLPGAPAPVRALEVGPRAGFDNRSEALILGAQLRVPVDPWLRADFVAGADVFFRSGVTERQYHLEGTIYLDPGRVLYLGGGAAFLDTFFQDEDGALMEEREVRNGYSLFGGFHGTAAPGGFAPHIELRWTFVDVYEAQTIHVGVSYFLGLGS